MTGIEDVGEIPPLDLVQDAEHLIGVHGEASVVVVLQADDDPLGGGVVTQLLEVLDHRVPVSLLLFLGLRPFVAGEGVDDLGPDEGGRVGVRFGARKPLGTLFLRSDQADARGEVADGQPGAQTLELELAQEIRGLQLAHDVEVDHVEPDVAGEGDEAIVGAMILGAGHV